MSEILIKEYRGNVVENIHRGNIAIVTSSGDTVAYLGDIEKPTFMRSASKPIQVLPTLLAGLHTKYGLNEEETAILSSSHWGSSHHIYVLEEIARKTGINPDDMIMLPCASTSASALAAKLTDKSRLHPREGKSKLQHCCSGKHFSLMMLQRELTGSVTGYEHTDSPVQKQILGFISMLSQTPTYKIGLGIDGCGVPVFALPLRSIAMSYARLVDPFSLSNELRETIDYNFSCIHAHPEKINDYGTPSYYVNSNPDLIMKDGSRGVICMAIRSMKLGIAVKLEDGWTDEFQGLILADILEQLHYDNDELIQQLRSCYTDKLYNDCGIEVGHSESDFRLDVDEAMLRGHDDEDYEAYDAELDSAFIRSLDEDESEAADSDYKYSDVTDDDFSDDDSCDSDSSSDDSLTDSSTDDKYEYDSDDDSVIDDILAEIDAEESEPELSPDELKSLRNKQSILGMTVVKPSTRKTFISNPLVDPISAMPTSVETTAPADEAIKASAEDNKILSSRTDKETEAKQTASAVGSMTTSAVKTTAESPANSDATRRALFSRDIKPANIISQKKRED